MTALSGIHWLRALLGGFLAEVSVITLVLPLAVLFGNNTLAYSAPAASLLACFVFAAWVGRRLASHHVLHGILVGVIATLIYVALTKGRPEPPAYLVAHALKLLGGAAGGFVAARRQRLLRQLDTPAEETQNS
jgi:putative membrane protein (TIGR04086 family)